MSDPPAVRRRSAVPALVLAALTQAALEAAWAVLQNPAPAVRYQLLAAGLVVGGALLLGVVGGLVRIPAALLLACWPMVVFGLQEGKKAAAAFAGASAVAALVGRRFGAGLGVSAIVVGASTGVTAIAAQSWARSLRFGVLPPAYERLAVLAAIYFAASLLLLLVGRLLERSPARAAAAIVLIAFAGTLAPVAAGAWKRITQAPPPQLPATRDGPTFLLLMLDTLRADHLGLYGYERDTTPRLRAFLGKRPNAVVFRNACSPGPWTVPSHASLFTGVLPSEHGADMPLMPPPSLSRFGGPVLAEELRDAGYRTTAVFANPWLEIIPGFERGFEVFRKLGTPHVLPPTGERLRRLAVPGWCSRVDNPEVSGTEVAAAVERALDGNAGRFVFANFMDVHSPLAPEPETHGLYAPAHVRDRYPSHFHFADGEAFLKRQLDRYDEKIAYLDAVLADLLERLDRSGVLANAWTFLVSDHGEAFGEHGTLMHGSTVYGEQVRVPFIVLPPAGATVEDDGEAVSLVDVTATIRAIAGIAPSGPGRDLRAPRPDDHVVRVEFSGVDWRPTFARSQSVEAPALALFRGRYKLVLQPDRAELYDLEEDPDELRDISRDRPEIVEALKSIAGPLEKLRRNVSAGDGEAIDPEAMRRLEAIGYGVGERKR